MFLTPEQTGGPLIFALRDSNCYLAVQMLDGFGILNGTRYMTTNNDIYVTLEMREFDVRQLAEALDQDAGETWQTHASLIKLACVGGRLFEWLDMGNKDQEVK